jgi:hypothetical protein
MTRMEKSIMKLFPGAGNISVSEVEREVDEFN